MNLGLSWLGWGGGLGAEDLRGGQALRKFYKGNFSVPVYQVK